MSWDKIIIKIQSGVHDKNIRFQNLRKLILHYGFTERIRGDHHIFTK